MPDEIIDDGGSGDAIEDGGITKDGIEEQGALDAG